MPIARVTCPERGATDRLLGSVAARLNDESVRIVGALREVPPSGVAGHCHSALRLLPDGPVLEITQDLGTGSAACRMDAGALENAVGIATARMAANDADLLLLNKFGLSEAEGRGFRSLIAEAVARGIPVLVGVPEVHRAAFDSFADGMATALDADQETVLAWCRAHRITTDASTKPDHDKHGEQA